MSLNRINQLLSSLERRGSTRTCTTIAHANVAIAAFADAAATTATGCVGLATSGTRFGLRERDIGCGLRCLAASATFTRAKIARAGFTETASTTTGGPGLSGRTLGRGERIGHDDDDCQEQRQHGKSLHVQFLIEKVEIKADRRTPYRRFISTKRNKELKAAAPRERRAPADAGEYESLRLGNPQEQEYRRNAPIGRLEAVENRMPSEPAALQAEV